MNWLRERFSWRNLAIAMTAACGALLVPASPVGGGLLLVAAIALAVFTHKWVRL